MGSSILIGGATGATGRAAIAELLKKGLSVRALVHSNDDRARQLEAQGAEIFVGDLLDLRSVRRAFEGIKRAYFVYPVRPGLIEATAIFVQAAKEANNEFIVNMSQISAVSNVPSNASLNHWLVERVFYWAGIPVTHIQPTAFHSWVFFSGKMIAEEGRFGVPLGPTGKFASVGTEDLGAVIATILAEPSGHGGKTYPIMGPVESTPPEIAKIISDALGRKIRYERVTAGELIQSFTGQTMPYLEQHFDAAGQMHTDGLLGGTNDLIEKITGRRPESLAGFIEKNRTFWDAK